MHAGRAGVSRADAPGSAASGRSGAARRADAPGSAESCPGVLRRLPPRQEIRTGRPAPRPLRKYESVLAPLLDALGAGGRAVVVDPADRLAHVLALLLAALEPCGVRVCGPGRDRKRLCFAAPEPVVEVVVA